MSSEQRDDVQAWRGVSLQREEEAPARSGDIRALEQAIMQDARQEADRMLNEARERAENTRAEARAEANDERDTILERARREAQVLREQAVASAHIEAQKLRLRRREQLLQRPFDQARRRLRSLTERSDYGEIARDLVRDAVGHLDTDNALVRTDAETRKVLTDHVLADLSSELGVYLRASDPLDHGTGVVVETPDGHRRYDNTLETRLARMRDALRTSVYRILTGEG